MEDSLRQSLTQPTADTLRFHLEADKHVSWRVRAAVSAGRGSEETFIYLEAVQTPNALPRTEFLFYLSSFSLATAE